jgi:FkbM family methyltransferase
MLPRLKPASEVITGLLRDARARWMIYSARMTLSARSKLLLRRLGFESIARRAIANRKVAKLTGLLGYGYRRNLKDDFHLSLIMSFILNDDSNCIDVGANQGTILQQMRSLAPNGHHLAFEPIPQLADRLSRLYPDVNVQSLALSDSNGTARFSCVVGDEAYSGLSDRHFTGSDNLVHFDVQTARLDDVIPNDFAPTFIKIDVEGAEYQVLNGAIATLKRYRPTIWLEHGARSTRYFDATSAHIWDLLTDMEYRFFDADGNGPITREDFGANGRMWSFVAH